MDDKWFEVALVICAAVAVFVLVVSVVMMSLGTLHMIGWI